MDEVEQAFNSLDCSALFTAQIKLAVSLQVHCAGLLVFFLKDCMQANMQVCQIKSPALELKAAALLRY